mmetsp:Transcript_2602/g.3296  ORF Transcript_2602/g.3296 Transcript_2602/m.3296 type:complete len:98 (+) Transcript_2602:45-338(+)
MFKSLWFIYINFDTVPEQENGCDCGVYSLEFIERLLTCDFEIFMSVVNTPQVGFAKTKFNRLFGSKWFTQIEVAKKRHKMASIVRELSTQQNVLTIN